MALEPDFGISFEKTEGGVYAIVVTAGDVQVGWCRKCATHWVLFDMDENPISSDLPDLKAAKAEGLRLFAHLASCRNPGY